MPRYRNGLAMYSALRLLWPLWLCVALLLARAAPAAEAPGAAAVASAHPLATQTGVAILEQGGNAFDAAVAVSAALGVVEPYSSGMGGGGFWLLHRASNGKQTVVDGRERAPLAAHKRLYLDKDDRVIEGASRTRALAAGIPGQIAALAHLSQRYGALSLKQALAPAIRLARDGFVVTQGYRELAEWRLADMKQDAETARLFLKRGAVPELGARIVQKDLARMLELVAAHGPSAFYEGPYAQQLVDGVRAAGGIWSLEDLARYRVIERAPIVTQYRGMRVVSAPPPSSGGVVLAQALGMLAHADLAAQDDVTRKHLVAEALRRAYRDRAVFLGDPDFVDIPTGRLLDADYLAGLAESMDPARATPSDELGDTPGLEQAGTNTTHFSIIDRDGNRVAATLSINLPFGACFVPPGSGLLLNDEMDDFAVKANTPNAYGLVGDHANSIAGGKRPLSSMTPTFLESADRVGILGTPGGSRIISMVLLAALDFERGNGATSWVTLPRFHHQYLPDEILYEPQGLTDFEQQQLRGKGHALRQGGYRYGNMQAVLWDQMSGEVSAASDPRGEGLATVIPAR
jgi:gamma-glutamyltranspeptidase/glutathione hydrolase